MQIDSRLIESTLYFVSMYSLGLWIHFIFLSLCSPDFYAMNRSESGKDHRHLGILSKFTPYMHMHTWTITIMDLAVTVFPFNPSLVVAENLARLYVGFESELRSFSDCTFFIQIMSNIVAELVEILPRVTVKLRHAVLWHFSVEAYHLLELSLTDKHTAVIA